MPKYFNSIQDAIAGVECNPDVSYESFRMRTLNKLYDYLEVESEFNSIFGLKLADFIPVYSNLFAVFDYLAFVRQAIGEVENGVSYGQRTEQLFGVRGAEIVRLLIDYKE